MHYFCSCYVNLLNIKAIKTFLKIILIAILVLISIPAISLLILKNPVIQTHLARYVSGQLASSLGAKISIEKVSVTFINRVHLTNLYIEDQRGDTLLQAGKITANLSNINRENRLITIKKLTFYDTYVNFITDSSDVINLKFIIDYIKKPDREIAAERPWKIKVTDIEMENSRFCYSKDIIKPVSTGINFTEMDLGALNINLSDFTIQGDSISMKINELNFVEKSGFLVNSFKSRLIITNNLMHFEEVNIKTPFSEIRSDLAHLNFTDFTDFSDFVNLVNIDLIFQPSQISFSDISYFAPELSGYREEFNIAGILSGNVNDIKGDKIILSYNIHTRMETSFNLIGLPDFKNTFMHFDINNFITSTADIELLKLPGKRKPIELPDNFMKLGKIIYSGKFTGYPDDFVAYGRFRSNLGDVHSDLLIKPDTANTLRFVGRLKTIDFKIGELIDAKEKIGKISMIGNVEGFIASGSLNAEIESTIDSFEVFGYNYENIIVSGTLTERNFSGSFAVTDPNINLEFIGKADFSGENPEFAFTADVARARPYYLNIGKSDPSYFVSFLLKTNFTGNKLDDLNGEISLVNSLFSNADQQIQMYDFSLKAYNNQNNSDSIIIRSDLIDGEVYGSYKFSTLIQSFNKLANYYIPSFGQNEKPLSLSDEENAFSYNIRLKNIQPFILFFFHDFDLSNNTNFYGQFNPSVQQLTISAECPFFSFKENTLEDITVLAAGNNKEYEFTVSGSRLSFKNNLEIKNVNINAAVSSDTANILFVWDNLETPRYNGNIDVMTVFDKNDISGNTRMNIFSRPSSFHYNNVLWNILESEIAIETKFYKIDTLRIRNQDQDFYVYGTMSEDPTDVLYIKFSDLDISALNVFTKKAKIEMEGFLSGEASISDPINKPLFLSDLTIEEFKFNQEFLGKGFIHGFWNNDENKVELTAETQQGDNRQIQIKGDFYPENDVIDFNIVIDKLSMTMFEPFLAEVISDLRGLGSGNLSLKGTMNTPDLNGTISLQKTSLMVNYLFTRYYFTNDVRIVHNNVIFRDFEIFDEKGNKGISQGSIITNNLKSINLDLRLSANNFTFLNTTEKDNDLFYGRVNASGLIRFTGPLDDMYMDINAKTERNSVFFIPLFGVEEIYEHDFIQWVSQRDEFESLEKNDLPGGYEVQLKGLKMNFNLEVTPDAEVQLIFDPKVGDILRGRGNGNLKLSINTLGKFDIFGDIIIERGDYLFTLKNLINKYFQVEQGGRISWTGDPLDANINLRAIYRLRTSVHGLAPEPIESLKKRVPVETHILMTGKLMNPTITPEIQLPTADHQTRNILSNRISTDEEMMRQFISLLVINDFYSDINPTGFGGATQRGSGVATSELFSNQLSRWLSQLSKDFDVGLNYRIGDEITTDQLEVALSTQIFNDRLSISGNFGVGGQQTAPAQTLSNPNNIVGDFDIDFRLTESGKIHLKAFNRTNDNFLFSSPYTQGVGITYRENFNSFRELMKRYKDAVLSIFMKDQRKKIRPDFYEEEDEDDDRSIEISWIQKQMIK